MGAQRLPLRAPIIGDYLLRTLSMWAVRSSILLEKPHSLSYQATSLTKLGFRLMPALNVY